MNKFRNSLLTEIKDHWDKSHVPLQIVGFEGECWTIILMCRT